MKDYKHATILLSKIYMKHWLSLKPLINFLNNQIYYKKAELSLSFSYFKTHSPSPASNTNFNFYLKFKGGFPYVGHLCLIISYFCCTNFYFCKNWNDKFEL